LFPADWDLGRGESEVLTYAVLDRADVAVLDDRARAEGFFLSDQLVARVLLQAGESP
jgi:predicted nucleic acid-binding protein